MDDMGHELIGDFLNMATLGGGVLSGVAGAGTTQMNINTGSASGSSNLTEGNFTNSTILAGTVTYSLVP